MNQNNQLLSIAIPTKNRQYYCIEVIKHILSYDNQDFELCIHDHSDDRKIEDFVSTIEDKRLKYIYTAEAISSSENMSRSIQMTSGEYVCMIGDDDTVLPTIFKWAKYMKENDIDSICPGYRPEYFWPNEKTGNTGTLKIVQYKYMKEIEEIEPMERVKELFKNGIIDYQEYNLPRVYHGLVRKLTLNQIYNKVGSYFSGLSPDIYSTIALTSIVDNHITIKEAISIAGACPSSTTSQSRLGGHKGVLMSAPHFRNNENYQWDNLIPAFYSVETIWAESAVRASKDFKMHSILKVFNKNLFDLTALYRNMDIFSYALSKINSNNPKYVKKITYYIFAHMYKIRNFIHMVYSKLIKKETKNFINIKSIECCVEKCI